jgi:3-hydroxyisobutyrate dehydrogenase
MSANPADTTVGFIGAGVMGRSMAAHLLAAGFRLHIHTRTGSKAAELVTEGAVWADTVAELAPKCNVIITIVGFPEDVEAVYLGTEGLIAGAQAGTVLVDMTTSRPDLAVRINAQAHDAGMQTLDAPVSGGDVGAREARLSIMVGGDREAFDRTLPILELMGANVVYQGPAGSGQHTKMCNQIAIASGMMGVCEAMAYAERSGLDPQTVLKSIESGAAGSWSLSNLAPRMLATNFAPGFYVKHFIKDMKIAIDAARAMELAVPGLELAESLYERLAAEGGENDGTQALYRLYCHQDRLVQTHDRGQET